MMNNTNKMIYKISWRNRPAQQNALSEICNLKINLKSKSNCKNCGAPLHGLKCEYCGTEYNQA